MTLPGSLAPAGTLLSLLLAAALGGCAATAPSGYQAYSASTDGPGNPHRVLSSLTELVRNLPKSRSGNPLKYTVFGQEYQVMDSAAGFVEEGLASWYGAKFHGRLTSSGEPYDMHTMTAAHKHLPLPTFVKVTRTDTGASLVVKVNDRGPFVDDRIIDLSYAAAVHLDMLESGTAPVRIEALSSHEQEEIQASAVQTPAEAADVSSAAVSREEVTDSIADTIADPDMAVTGVGKGLDVRSTLPVLQFGAFSQSGNAEDLQARLDPVLDVPVIIVRDADDGLFRVQSGPLSDQESLDAALASLDSAGIRPRPVLRRSP